MIQQLKNGFCSFLAPDPLKYVGDILPIRWDKLANSKNNIKTSGKNYTAYILNPKRRYKGWGGGGGGGVMGISEGNC